MAPAISNVHGFPSYSASIFVLHEQIIIYEVFNDKFLLSLGCNTSLSETVVLVASLTMNCHCYSEGDFAVPEGVW